ncbi:hypothetical protein HR45_07215 [Shewanella mangrovi]|uniref:Type IV pilin Tt1218-like domain-containing protein n=1 Tax=Shewanella mangrovi TaxID=1515746 RepID=A0A094JJP4_9GAMM|nr:hypothetical protein HR45_07215 [Shewanella mangrovi]
MAVAGDLTLVNVKRAGFSLIEVMVALVILVIGLIGIFNLHIVAKRSSFESFQQTTAAYLANDILNRMKLNKTVIDSYIGPPNITSADSCDAAVNCSPADMAEWDVYQWNWLMSGGAEEKDGTNVGGLDSSIGCISVDYEKSDETGKVKANVSIAIAWRGIQGTAGTSASDSTCGSSLGARRRLFVLESVIDGV